MLKPIRGKQFKKDYKLMTKRPVNLEELHTVMKKILKKEALDSKYKNHFLQGQLKEYQELHILNDWLLIYKVDLENKKVLFFRTGTHSDLFKK